MNIETHQLYKSIIFVILFLYRNTIPTINEVVTLLLGSINISYNLGYIITEVIGGIGSLYPANSNIRIIATY